MEEGKTRAIEVSNLTLAQLKEFAADAPIVAFQPPYNMLHARDRARRVPWCREHGVAVLVYWPLMKGLLAGKIAPTTYCPRATAGGSIACSTASSGGRTTI